MTNLEQNPELLQMVANYLDAIYFEGYSETLSSAAFNFEVANFCQLHNF